MTASRPSLAQHAFDALPEALVVTTLDGRIVATNPAFDRLVGRPADSLAGVALGDVFEGGSRALEEVVGSWARSTVWRPAGLRADLGAGPARVTATGTRLPGTDRILVRVQPGTEGSRAFSALSRSVELDDLRRLRRHLETALEELSWSNRRLEAVNEELERYAAMISHDVRGPLHIAREFALMLRDSEELELPEEEEQMLGSIIRLTGRVSDAANALLQLARAGSFGEVEGEADPAVAAAKAIEQLGVDVSSDVTVDVSPVPPVHVHEPHLVQILANLIGNSVRYRDPDRPLHVRVSGELDGPWVHTDVSDDGPGIDPEDRDRIFEPHVRGRRAHDEGGGTGLGLALCQRLVSGYGGSIELLETHGPGATFRFTLPGARDALSHG